MCDSNATYDSCSFVIEIWRAVQHHVSANPCNVLTIDSHILPYLPRMVQVDIVCMQICLRSITTGYTMPHLSHLDQSQLDKTWHDIIGSSLRLVSCLDSFCNLSNRDCMSAIHESTCYHSETKLYKRPSMPTIACIAKDDKNVCFVLQYYNGNVSMVNLQYDYRNNMKLPCMEPMKDIMMV